MSRISMLGLKKGMVKLVAHDTKWAGLFEKEEKLLRKALGSAALDIEHVGSTSVAGLAAKPILDIDVGVESTKDFDALINPLERAGYTQIKNKSAPHVHRVFAKGIPGKATTHYLHLIKYNGTTWKHDLAFRDILRRNKTIARQYAIVKRRLAKQYPDDRMVYTNGKKSFILKTIKHIDH